MNNLLISIVRSVKYIIEAVVVLVSSIAILFIIVILMVFLLIIDNLVWYTTNRQSDVLAKWKYENYKSLNFERSGGIVIGDDWFIYILDLSWENHRICRLDGYGKYLGDIDIRMPVKKTNIYEIFGYDYYELDLENVVSLPYILEEKLVFSNLTKAPDGSVYAFDDNNMALVRIDNNENTGKEIIKLHHERILKVPKGLAIDNNGMIYIGYDGNLIKYDGKGELVAGVDLIHDDSREPITIAGISVFSGRVMLACKVTNEILVLDDRLQKINKWKVTEEKTGEVQGIRGVATDNLGNVYAFGSWMSFKINKYTPDGLLITHVDAVRNTKDNPKKTPIQICIDKNNNVVCLYDDTIVKFTIVSK